MLCTQDKFSGYQIVKRLGEGSFGKVDLVKISSKEYVLKAIGIDQIEEALIEINNLKLLQGVPYTLQMYGVCYEPIKEQISIFSEPMDNNLSGWAKIQTKETIRKEVPRILLHISTALDNLHQLHIGHFDIKPGNILCKLTPLGMIYKLADFGSSSLKYRMDELSFGVGTYIYQAPEVLLKLSTGLASDVWSLGISVMTLLYVGYQWSLSDRGDVKEICDVSIVYPEMGHIDCNEFVQRYKNNTIEGHLYIPRDMPNRDLFQRMMQLNPADRPSFKDIQEHFGQAPHIVQINDVYPTQVSVDLETLNDAWRLYRQHTSHPTKGKSVFSIDNVRDIIAVEILARYLSTDNEQLSDYAASIIAAFIAEHYINVGFADVDDYIRRGQYGKQSFYNDVFLFLLDIDYRIYNPHLQTAIQNLSQKYINYSDDYSKYIWYYTFTNPNFDNWFTESYIKVMQRIKSYSPVVWKKNVFNYNPPFDENSWHKTILQLRKLCKQNDISSERGIVWIIYIFRMYLEDHKNPDTRKVMNTAINTYKRNNLGISYTSTITSSDIRDSFYYPYFNTIIDYISVDGLISDRVYTGAKTLALRIYSYDTYSIYNDVDLAKTCIDIAYDRSINVVPNPEKKSKLYMEIYNDKRIVG